MRSRRLGVWDDLQLTSPPPSANDKASPWNVNLHSPAVVRDTLLCSALGSHVAVGAPDPGGSTWKAPQPIGRVVLHPSSTLSNKRDLARTRPLLVYTTLNVTTQPFIREVSAVSPVGLMLFGPGFAIRHAEARVSLQEDALSVSVDAQTAVLIKALRGAVQRDLAQRIAQPCADVNTDLLQVVARVIKENDATSRVTRS